MKLHIAQRLTIIQDAISSINAARPENIPIETAEWPKIKDSVSQKITEYAKKYNSTMVSALKEITNTWNEDEFLASRQAVPTPWSFAKANDHAIRELDDIFTSNKFLFRSLDVKTHTVASMRSWIELEQNKRYRFGGGLSLQRVRTSAKQLVLSDVAVNYSPIGSGMMPELQALYGKVLDSNLSDALEKNSIAMDVKLTPENIIGYGGSVRGTMSNINGGRVGRPWGGTRVHLNFKLESSLIDSCQIAFPKLSSPRCSKN